MIALLPLFIVEEYDDAEKKASLKEDITLAEGLKAGDTSSMERIFSKYYDHLYAFINRYLRHEEHAADMTQEAFLKLFGAASKVKTEKGIKNYLFTIAINLCHNEKKKKDNRVLKHSIDELHEKGMSLADQNTGHEKKFMLQEMEDHLAELVDNLPEKEKDVILMRKIGNMPFKEISDTLGFSLRYVKYLASNAIEKITAGFDKAGFTVDGNFAI